MPFWNDNYLLNSFNLCEWMPYLSIGTQKEDAMNEQILIGSIAVVALMVTIACVKVHFLRNGLL